MTTVPTARACAYCGDPLPAGSQRNRRTCSTTCRARLSQRHTAEARAAEVDRLRAAAVAARASGDLDALAASAEALAALASA